MVILPFKKKERLGRFHGAIRILGCLDLDSVCADSKLVPAREVAYRDAEAAKVFMNDLAKRTKRNTALRYAQGQRQLPLKAILILSMSPQAI